MTVTPSQAYADWSNDDLLKGLQTGDEKAFAEIFRRYSPRLFVLAYNKLSNRDAAEEIVQDIFENLWLKRSTSLINQLDYYLQSAIKYRIINYIRDNKVREGYLTYYRIYKAEAVTTTEEAIAVNDLSAALFASMKKLPKKSYEIFRLSRLEHFTVMEIAAIVKLSPKTVEYHLTQAIKILRVQLREFLVVLAPLILLFTR